MAVLFVYCCLVFGASWLGGVLPALLRLTHTRLQMLISLIGGLMLGVGLLHQLPHAVSALNEAGVRSPLDTGLLWMVAGLTVMFFLLRTFHFHQHDIFDEPAPEHRTRDAQHHDCGHDHGHSHNHSHSHNHDHSRSHEQDHQQHAAAAQSWMGLAFGLSVHTLSDGLALAAHLEADLAHAPAAWLPGLGTFLGVALHKPLDSLSIASLMSASGTSRASRRLMNLAYALICPLGALLFQLGVRTLTQQQNLVVGSALAFSAGMFVCIALSDLLPEVQFHSHDRAWLSLSLLAGLVLAWAIGFVEPEHAHGVTAPSAAPVHSHDHRHEHDGHRH